MDEILNGILEAFYLIFSMDHEVMEIARRSLTVSLEATFIAALIAIPLGAAVYYFPFRGKRIVVGTIQTLYALPTVLVGLLVYLMVSNSGPLGAFRLLYTTNAMVLAQVLLVIPIIAGLTIAALSGLDKEMKYTIQSLNANALQAITTLCREAKFAILAAVMLAFGRAIAEVGAVMMVGGNIRHFTRTLTTAISLNTSMGEFATSIALGIILLSIALVVNFAMNIIQTKLGEGKDA